MEIFIVRKEKMPWQGANKQEGYVKDSYQLITFKQIPWLSLMGNLLPFVVINIVSEYCNDDTACISFPALSSLHVFDCNWQWFQYDIEKPILKSREWYHVTNKNRKIEYVQIRKPCFNGNMYTIMHSGTMVFARTIWKTSFYRYDNQQKRWDFISEQWFPTTFLCIDRNRFYVIVGTSLRLWNGEMWEWKKHLECFYKFISMIMYETMLYAFDETSNTLMRLTLDQTWVVCFTLQYRRSEPCLIVCNSLIFICGGDVNLKANGYTMECYDPQKDQYLTASKWVSWNATNTPLCDGQEMIYYHP